VNNEVRRWLEESGDILDRLADANGLVTRQAGRCERLLEAGDARSADALQLLWDRAADLLSVIHDAQALPPIPDAEISGRFLAVLARWEDACSAVIGHGAANDASAAVRAVSGLMADGVEFLLVATALGRATGQLPDPQNPRS